MTAPERLLGGRYQVGELLGYGGMAEVHQGRDLRLGRDVAIKMLRPDLARDNTFQMRFRREAQNAATLNHPGIVAVYDTGEQKPSGNDTIPYIVMEFVAGRTLKEVLGAEGRLQSRRALEITADICAALEFSHRHGIIHRDIKPGNVMLTPNGQVKVMDFGIARALASGATTMTQTSAVIGTAQYLSPEQARGEAVDARSDVYAAGCVLFELVCGHPPFVGDSAVAVAYQHVREDARPPSEFNPEVGPDLDAVVLKALAKNPANRYQSAAEMRADLLRAAAGRPVLATPVLRDSETALVGDAIRPGGGGPARVGDADRRRASTWVIASLAVLGVLAVIALITGLILSNQDTPDPVTVPSVIGLSAEDADAALTAEGLVPSVGEPVLAVDCTEGEVTEQSPEAGVEARAGDTVTYRVCGGPQVHEVPNVVGSTEDAARRTLEGLNFIVEVEPVNSTETEGLVVETDPPAETSRPEGSTIILRVSQGNLTDVPNVVGRSRVQAEAALDAAGFDVEVVPATDPATSPADVDTVASQEPAAGTERQRGSKVTIFVYQPGAALAVGEPTVEGLEATVTWQNGIYGQVRIDWGDNNDEIHGAEGAASHTYAADGTYTITITAVDHPTRTESRQVTVAAGG